MCKQQGRTFCSELGADPSLLSKEAPLPKPSWIMEAFKTLADSVQMASTGELDLARDLLTNSRELEMREWFNVHAQNSGVWRLKSFQLPAPEPILPLVRVKTFKKFELTIFARSQHSRRFSRHSLRTTDQAIT
jgi:hypothetical protein